MLLPRPAPDPWSRFFPRKENPQAKMLSCLLCSRLQFALMLWILCTPTCARTVVSLMQSVNSQVSFSHYTNLFIVLIRSSLKQEDDCLCIFQAIRPAQSPGVQEELWPVSLVWEVVVLTALDRVPLEMYPFDHHCRVCHSFQKFIVLGPTLDLQWWCNLRPTGWPVTECLLSYTGTNGWRSLILSIIKGFITFAKLSYLSNPLTWLCIDVSWRSHVCPDQDLAPLAPQDQHNPEALCHLLCLGCLCYSCTCDV